MLPILNDEFTDIFRLLHPHEKIYSFWENSEEHGKDYFLISNRLVPKITNINIDTNIFGSDHASILLFVTFDD